MNLIESLLKRNSHGKLIGPPPSEEQLATLFEVAMRTPDHGYLRPWQFIKVSGATRNKLGDIFLQASLEVDGDLSEARQEKIKKMPLRAPMVLICIAKPTEHVKVPEIEQVIATGAAIMNIQHAAQAMGIYSMWRTGDMAYCEGVKQALGLSKQDHIVGYLYLGDKQGKEKKIRPVDWQQHVSELTVD